MPRSSSYRSSGSPEYKTHLRFCIVQALAGAKTLMLSLWKVPDEETRELMEDFYGRILRGQPRAEALRATQLEMKKK